MSSGRASSRAFSSPASAADGERSAVDRQTAALEQLAIEMHKSRVALAHELAATRETLVVEVEKVLTVIGPAAEAAKDLNAAQKKLCSFILKHRVKILLSIPFVLTGIGAISPNAAQWLREAFDLWRPR